MNQVTRTMTAANQASSPITLKKGSFSVSVWGTFVATLTVQKSPDEGTTWTDIGTYTTPSEITGEEGTAGVYRGIVKAAEYTSGTIYFRIRQ